MAKKPSKPKNYQAWIEARTRCHLSAAHIQMARELGTSPKKLGTIAHHTQEPWKAPLPVFIEEVYVKRFGRRRPGTVLGIEQHAEEKRKKQGRASQTPTTEESEPGAAGIAATQKKKIAL